MKVLPFHGMEQYIFESFKWWYKNSRTGEAVIVLCEEKVWRTILIYDPMWIVNMSEKDIEIVFFNHSYFDHKDIEQALQFQCVVRICFAYSIYVGSKLETKWRKLEEKERSKRS
ncbi:hypothetical protein Hanom_Chr00s001439g01682491 [Helianthus anomalus]